MSPLEVLTLMAKEIPVELIWMMMAIVGFIALLLLGAILDMFCAALFKRYYKRKMRRARVWPDDR